MFFYNEFKFLFPSIFLAIAIIFTFMYWIIVNNSITSKNNNKLFSTIGASILVIELIILIYTNIFWNNSISVISDIFYIDSFINNFKILLIFLLVWMKRKFDEFHKEQIYVYKILLFIKIFLGVCCYIFIGILAFFLVGFIKTVLFAIYWQIGSFWSYSAWQTYLCLQSAYTIDIILTILSNIFYYFNFINEYDIFFPVSTFQIVLIFFAKAMAFVYNAFPFIIIFQLIYIFIFTCWTNFFSLLENTRNFLMDEYYFLPVFIRFKVNLFILIFTLLFIIEICLINSIHFNTKHYPCTRCRVDIILLDNVEKNYSSILEVYSISDDDIYYNYINIMEIVSLF